MPKLTDQQAEIIRYIADSSEVHGYSPTIKEIATWVGLTPVGAADEVAALIASGRLSHEPGTVRGIRVIGG